MGLLVEEEKGKKKEKKKKWAWCSVSVGFLKKRKWVLGFRV